MDIDQDIRVHAIYVIAEDGRTAFHKAYSNNAPPTHLVSAMLTAMQVFIKEVTGENFSEVTAGPFTFVSEKVGPFSVVIISSKSHKITEKAKFLTLRFIRKYKNAIENWGGETVIFADFEKDVEDIFGKVEDIRIDPKNPLDIFRILSLPEEFQPIVKYLLIKGEAPLTEISDKLNIGRYILQKKLESMVEQGNIGRYVKDQDFVYFIL